VGGRGGGRFLVRAALALVFVDGGFDTEGAAERREGGREGGREGVVSKQNHD